MTHEDVKNLKPGDQLLASFDSRDYRGRVADRNDTTVRVHWFASAYDNIDMKSPAWFAVIKLA